MTTTSAPPVIPGHTFVKALGKGGYAEVLLYEQDLSKMKVAVKLLTDDYLDEETRERFYAEANAMAELSEHPHIVTVFNADMTAHGRPYLTMQYYAKPALNVRARREQLSVAEVLRVGIQVTSAVETAHRVGILHRDIKPANILTDQYGRPGLCDFGIASRHGDGPAGMSIPWSPPEVLAGGDGDVRSDVYSLGATLWHLLAGHSPFHEPGGDNDSGALTARVLAGNLPKLPRGDVPESLHRLLRQCMARSPEMRPQTALALARQLQAIEQEMRWPLTEILVLEEDPDAPVSVDDDADATRLRPKVIEAQPVAPPVTEMVAPPPAQTVSEPDLLDELPTSKPGAVPRIVEQRTPPPASPRTPRQRAAAPEPPELEKTVGPKQPRSQSETVPPTDALPADVSLPETVSGGGRRTKLVAAAAAVVVAAVAVLLAVAVGGGSKQAADAKESTTVTRGSQQDPLGDSTPGKPTVTAKRTKQRVVFSWSYDGAQGDDKVLWQRTTTPVAKAYLTGAAAKARTLTLTGTGRICVVITAVRASGLTGEPSQETCG